MSWSATNAARSASRRVEQREVARPAAAARTHDRSARRSRRVAARGRDEADPRRARRASASTNSSSAGVWLHREAAAAHRDDVPGHAPVKIASGSTALTTYSPASTISEILRSTHEAAEQVGVLARERRSVASGGRSSPASRPGRRRTGRRRRRSCRRRRRSRRAGVSGPGAVRYCGAGIERPFSSAEAQRRRTSAPRGR